MCFVTKLEPNSRNVVRFDDVFYLFRIFMWTMTIILSIESFEFFEYVRSKYRMYNRKNYVSNMSWNWRRMKRVSLNRTRVWPWELTTSFVREDRHSNDNKMTRLIFREKVEHCSLTEGERRATRFLNIEHAKNRETRLSPTLRLTDIANNVSLASICNILF